jgi:hypothetical protein
LKWSMFASLLFSPGSVSIDNIASDTGCQGFWALQKWKHTHTLLTHNQKDAAVTGEQDLAHEPRTSAWGANTSNILEKNHRDQALRI